MPTAVELTCRAASGPGRQFPEFFDMRVTPEQTRKLPGLLAEPDSAPLFYDLNSDDEFVREMFARLGTVAMILAPIVARGEFLGTLSVTVDSEPTRLEPRRDLLDRLSGVVAQAASALQNGRLLDRVTHQARHDGLTGLANRSLFTERMDQALEAARESGDPVGLFFVDLDGFKAVNDEWGHPVGDALLCQVAARLLDTVRTGDTVARLGGDEFAIVLSGVSTAGRARGGRRARGARVRAAVRHRRRSGRHRGERGPRHLARGRVRDRGADAPRRRRDVPRQALRSGAREQPRLTAA